MGDIVVEQSPEMKAFAAFWRRNEGEISYGLAVQAKYDRTLSRDCDLTRMRDGVFIPWSYQRNSHPLHGFHKLLFFRFSSV